MAKLQRAIIERLAEEGIDPRDIVESVACLAEIDSRLVEVYLYTVGVSK